MRNPALVFMLCAVSLVGMPAPSGAQWQKMTAPPEIDLQQVACDSRDQQILYVASIRRVYESRDAGATWKRVVTVKGAENRIHQVYPDERVDGRVYVASDDGLKWRPASGSKWTMVPLGAVTEARKVFAVARDDSSAEAVYVGTSQGLYRWDPRQGGATKVDGIRQAVRALMTTPRGTCAQADDGVYWMDLKTRKWTLTLAEIRAEEESVALEQYDIEEFASPVVGPGSIGYLAANGLIYVAGGKSLVRGELETGEWSRLSEGVMPVDGVRALAATSVTHYAATNRGIYGWDEQNRLFKQANDGLDTLDTRSIVYHPGSDSLYAATSAGVYRWTHPELSEYGPGPALEGRKAAAGLGVAGLLSGYEREPGIREVQEAAVRYAEVHPDKIAGWRAAAARKPLLPTVSVNAGMDRDETVDIDRGVTNDPDTFIFGPAEKSFDWSVGLNWDLGDWVWSTDQTSIDVRSRLMVELREDILSEVTHLYFERRKLQVEMDLSPARELPVMVEKELRLQELTASIDALTGGFLSARLADSS